MLVLRVLSVKSLHSALFIRALFCIKSFLTLSVRGQSRLMCFTVCLALLQVK